MPARWKSLPEPVRYYLRYTAAFVGMALLVFLLFIVKGKGFVWRADALPQHFNAFMYLGDWLRGVLAALFAGSPEFPMYEFSLGYGGDVVTSLSYYVFGDVFALVSVFFPQEFAEVGYTISILLRYYCTGIAFSVFARRMGCDGLGALCGALVYAFCSFSLYAGVRHPYFLDPMIWMPLIFFGLEKVLAKESPVPYIVFVSLMTLSNFYFLYMVLILTAIYGACRLLIPPYTRTARETIALVLKLVLFTFLGIGIGCVIFLPTAMAFRSNARVSGAYEFDPLYPWTYYGSLLGACVTSRSPGWWARVGMAPMCWFGVAAFLVRKNQDRSFKAYFLILGLMLLIPLVGHVMNGMGYVTNRWVFGWSFWAAFLFAKGLPSLLKPSRRLKIGLTVACVAFALLALWGIDASDWKNTVFTAGGVVVLLACSIPVWVTSHIRKRQAEGHMPQGEKIVQLGYSAVTSVCILWMAVSLFWGYTNEFVESGAAAERLEGSSAGYVDATEDEGFFRVDHDVNHPRIGNLALLAHQSSTTFYWSLVNPNVVAFLNENSAFSTQDYSVKGLMSRSLLLPLVSAKYHVAASADDAVIPYGFERVRNGGTTALYESQYSLPFGYTYENAYPAEALDGLTFAQRQQAMLQGAFVDGTEAPDDMDASAFTFTDQKLEYSAVAETNATLEGNVIVTKAANATVELSFDCPAQCELYVEVDGLSYEGSATETNITAKSGSIRTSATHYTSKHIYAKGRSDYLLNLGYSDEERTSLTLMFSAPGMYRFSGLAVVCQPMDAFEERIDALRQDVLEDVEFKTNKISGRISLEEPKLLCLSLPYSKGWTATVDGQPAETLRTNTMFAGIMLPAGEHEVVLTYETPYIKIGFTISAISLLITVLVGIRWRRKNAERMHDRADRATSDGA